ncbi:helix-turn-helix domain-containing protein [Okeania sp. KiyG1]|uniref:helix-turn-helix domain-containing protein n=1 Tax=Okeania sp. KiyG1 TaxID=2720165 RepID=UPI001F221FBB|nr:helix-turn-helix domain-containing protein [Okeania sp. KiyG1]
MRRTLGCVRLVYNQALDARTQAWYELQERGRGERPFAPTSKLQLCLRIGKSRKI